MMGRKTSKPVVAWSCVLEEGCKYPDACGPEYCRKEHYRLSGEGTTGMSVRYHPTVHADLDATGLPRIERRTP